jgi:hypothetical protein
MRIPQEQSVGLVVDVQSRLFPYMYDAYGFQQNLRTLIAGLQILDLPLLVTQQYTKGLGETVDPIRKSFESFDYIEKTAFSCVDEPAFMEALERSGRTHVIIGGIEAHVCMLQTSMDLLAAGYTPVVVEDATSSRKAHDKRTAVERMRHAGVVVTTTESVLFELCRYSGTETFKALSKLVK